MKRFLRSKIAIIVAALSLLLVPAAAHASLAPNLSQSITAAGAVTANFYQTDDQTIISSPAVAFSAKNYSFQCQTSTGTLADGVNGDSGYLNVTNLASGISTWNIAVAATSGPTATWTSGGNTYKFNDATGSPTGCTNGQMTVNIGSATLTDDCNSVCTANDSTITKGTSYPFDATTHASITLLTDSAGTAWEGYLSNIGLSQTIPPLTPAGTYTLPMTVTLTQS